MLFTTALRCLSFNFRWLDVSWPSGHKCIINARLDCKCWLTGAGGVITSKHASKPIDPFFIHWLFSPYVILKLCLLLCLLIILYYRTEFDIHDPNIRLITPDDLSMVESPCFDVNSVVQWKISGDQRYSSLQLKFRALNNEEIMIK